MNDEPGVMVARLAVLGAAVLVMVCVLSVSPCDVCIVAAVVLGLTTIAAGMLAALAAGRR